MSTGRPTAKVQAYEKGKKEVIQQVAPELKALVREAFKTLLDLEHPTREYGVGRVDAILVNLTPEEKELFQEAAKKAGVSPAVWVRYLLGVVAGEGVEG